MFFTINKDGSGEVILSADNEAWGSYFYNPENDILRAQVEVINHEHTERLTYQFVDVKPTSVNLVLDWELKRFIVPVAFDVPELVFENARVELTGPTGFSWQGYNSGAVYLSQHNIHMETALAWSKQALKINPNFITRNVNAAILRKVGKLEEAKAVMEDALKEASEVQMNQYGYQLMNEGYVKGALDVFEANVAKYPKSANAFDSLGEALFKLKQFDEAEEAFKMALSLSPQPNVKENSEKYLKLIRE